MQISLLTSLVSRAPFSQHEVMDWQLINLVPLTQKDDFLWNKEKLEKGLLMPETHSGYMATVVPKYIVPYSSNVYGYVCFHSPNIYYLVISLL